MSVASTEATDLIQNSYLTAVKGVQGYNNKFFEFAHENTNAAFDFIQKMSSVRSPSAFIELSTEHARKLASLTEQTKQLATLAQKASLATGWAAQDGLEAVGPLKFTAEDEASGSAIANLNRHAGVELGVWQMPYFGEIFVRSGLSNHGQKWVGKTPTQ
jgi:Phasin protein